MRPSALLTLLASSGAVIAEPIPRPSPSADADAGLGRFGDQHGLTPPGPDHHGHPGHPPPPGHGGWGSHPPYHPHDPHYHGHGHDHGSLFRPETYLSAHQQRTFTHLVASIIKSQESIARLSPSISSEFRRSIGLWIHLHGLIPEYSRIKQSHYIFAIEALRDALLRLGKGHHGHLNEIRGLTHELFFDNLFLVGFINDQYGSNPLPPALTDRPGDVMGALINFLGIDAREHLHCKGKHCGHGHGGHGGDHGHGGGPKDEDHEWELCPIDDPKCCEGPGPHPDCKKHKVGKKIIKYRKKKVTKKLKGHKKPGHPHHHGHHHHPENHHQGHRQGHHRQQHHHKGYKHHRLGWGEHP
ncbi:hypothetical protein N3K66_005792 [Trichothecium roseum]|uniref:Uncharacterized protein n=1 Tax=Trichothecium roseum TaxID=47278 RepID=A0ACC0UZ04_9HYPO|nr:hypothetical protein N3K66_005792 [Trichothecium roseum]